MTDPTPTRHRPIPILGWLALAVTIAVQLAASVWVVATMATSRAEDRRQLDRLISSVDRIVDKMAILENNQVRNTTEIQGLKDLHRNGGLR